MGLIIGKMLQERRRKLSFVQHVSAVKTVVELVSDNSRTGIIVIYFIDNII